MKKIILNDIKDFNSETNEVTVSLRDGNEIIEAKMTASEVDGNFVFANENFNFTLDKDFNVLDAKSGDEEIKLEGKVDANVDLSNLENVSSSDFDIDAHSSKESFDFVQTAEGDAISTDKDEAKDNTEISKNDFERKFSSLKNGVEKNGHAKTTIDKNVKVYANKVEGNKAIQYEMNYTVIDKNGEPLKTIYFGTRVPDVFKNNFEQIKGILDGIFDNPDVPNFENGQAIADFLAENHFADQVNSVLEADGMENQLYAFVGEKGNNLKIDGLMTHSEFEHKLEQKTDDDEDKTENKGKSAQNKAEKSNEHKEEKDERSKVEKSFDKITDPSEKFSYEFKSMEATWKLPKNSDSSFTVNSYYVDKDPLLDGQKMMVPAYTYTNEKGELVYERFVGDTPQLVNRTDADGFKPVNVTWELNKALGSSAGKKEPLISTIVDMIAGFEASKGFADGESMDEFKEEMADVIKKSSDAFQGRRVTYTPTYDKNGNLVSGSEIKGSQTTGTDIMGMAEFVSLLNQGFGLTARMNALELAPNTLAELRQDENFDIEKMTPEQTAKVLAEAKQTLDNKENELGSRIIVSADGKNKNAEIIKLRIQKTLYDQVFANYETILNDSNDLTRSAANRQKGLYHDMHATTVSATLTLFPISAIATGIVAVPLSMFVGFSIPLFGVIFAGMFALNAILTYKGFHQYFKDHYEARRDFVKNGVDIRIPRARIDNPEKLPKGYSYDKETGTLIMKVKLSPAELRKFEQANKLYKTTEKKVNGEETDTRKQRSEFLMQYLEAKGFKQLLDNGFNDLKDRGEVIDVLDKSNRELDNEIKKDKQEKLDRIEKGEKVEDEDKDEDDVEKEDEEEKDETEENADESEKEDGEDKDENADDQEDGSEKTEENPDEQNETPNESNPENNNNDNSQDNSKGENVDTSFDRWENDNTISNIEQRAEDYNDAKKPNQDTGKEIKDSCDKQKDKLSNELKDVESKLKDAKKGSPEEASLIERKANIVKDIAKLDNIKNKIDLKDLDLKIDAMKNVEPSVKDCYDKIDGLLAEKALLLYNDAEALSKIQDIDNSIDDLSGQLNELNELSAKVNDGYNDKLDNQIQNNNDKIADLQGKLKNLSVEKGQKTRQINSIENKIKTIDRMIENLDKTSIDLSDASSAVEKLGDDYKDLADKLKGASDLKDVKEALENKKAELNDLKDTLSKQRESLDTLGDKLKGEIETEKGKISKHEDAKIDVNSLNQKIDDITKKINDLKDEKAKLTGDNSERIGAIDNEINNLKNEIKNADSKKSNELEKLSNQRNELANKIDNNNNSKGDLRQRIEDFRNADVPSQKTYESIKEQISNAKTEISNELKDATNPDKKAELEKTLSALENADNILDNANDLGTLKGEALDLENAINDIDNQLIELNVEKDQITSEIDKAESEKAELTDKLNDAKTELSTINDKIKEGQKIDKTIDKLNSEIVKNSEKIKDLEQKIQDLSDKRDAIDAKISDLENKKEKIEKALDKVDKALESINDVKDVKELIDSDLLKELKLDGKNLKEIKDTLDKENKAIDNAEKGLRNEKADLGRKIGGAKRSLDTTTNKVDTLKNDLAEAQKSKEDFEKNNQGLESQKADILEKIDNIKADIAKIDANIESQNEKLNENAEKEKDLKAEKGNLENDLESKNVEIESKESEVETSKLDGLDKPDVSNNDDSDNSEPKNDTDKPDNTDKPANNENVENQNKVETESKSNDQSDAKNDVKNDAINDVKKDDTEKPNGKTESVKNTDGRIEKDTINVTKKGFKTIVEKKARDFDVNKIGAERPLPTINGELNKVPRDVVNDLKEKAIDILGAEKGKTFNNELLSGKVSSAEFNYASDVLDGVRQLQSTDASMKDIAGRLDVSSDDYRAFAYDCATYANDKVNDAGEKVDGTLNAIDRNPDFAAHDIEGLRSSNAPKMGFFERHFGNLDSTTKKINDIAKKFADIKIEPKDHYENNVDGKGMQLAEMGLKVDKLDKALGDIGDKFENAFKEMSDLALSDYKGDNVDLADKIKELKENVLDAKTFTKEVGKVFDARLAEIKAELKDLNEQKKNLDGKDLEKIQSKLQDKLGEKVSLRERIDDLKDIEKAIDKVDTQTDKALDKKIDNLMSDLKDKVDEKSFKEFEKSMNGLKGDNRVEYAKSVIEKYKAEFKGIDKLENNTEKLDKINDINQKIENAKSDKQQFDNADKNFKHELNKSVDKMKDYSEKFKGNLISENDKNALKNSIEKFGKAINKLEKQIDRIENNPKYSDAEKQNAKDVLGKQLDLMKTEYNKANSQMVDYERAKIDASRMPELMAETGISPNSIKNFETGNPDANLSVERIGGSFKGFNAVCLDYGSNDLKFTGNFMPDGNFKIDGYLDKGDFTGLSKFTDIRVTPDGKMEIKQAGKPDKTIDVKDIKDTSEILEALVSAIEVDDDIVDQLDQNGEYQYESVDSKQDDDDKDKSENNDLEDNRLDMDDNIDD